MGLLRQVLYLNPITGPSMILYDLAGNVVFDGLKDKGEEYIDEKGDEIIETVGNYIDDLETVLLAVAGGIGEGLGEIGEALGDLGSDIGNSLLGLIRYLGIAVIEGMEDTYAYIAGKVGGKKVQITSSVTILAIVMFTAFYIFARLPSGGDSE